jgi:hypothetical protein
MDRIEHIMERWIYTVCEYIYTDQKPPLCPCPAPGYVRSAGQARTILYPTSRRILHITPEHWYMPYITMSKGGIYGSMAMHKVSVHL